MQTLADKVGDIIRAQKLFPETGGIIVAVSGGIDSMALLHLLATPPLGLRERLVVAHFDHQLRGAESDADAAFVGQAAKRLGLPFEFDRGDMRKLATETGEGTEQLAAKAKQAEHARDDATAKYHHFELASAAFQIGIVLASATIITGMIALAWVAGALALTGLAFTAIGLFAPHAVHLM